MRDVTVKNFINKGLILKCSLYRRIEFRRNSDVTEFRIYRNSAEFDEIPEFSSAGHSIDVTQNMKFA